MHTINIPVSGEVEKKLELLSKILGTSETLLVQRALEDLIRTEEWQCQEIEKAIQEANQGDFASDAEVASIKDKWSES